MPNPLKLSETKWTPEDKKILASLIARKTNYIVRFIDNNEAGYTIVGSDSACMPLKSDQITDFLKVIRPLSGNSSSQFTTEHELNLRNGWLDTVELMKSLDSRSAVTGLIMAELDMLTRLKNIQICTNYLVPTNCNGDASVLSKPYYINTPGWDYSISACKDVKQLPQSAKNYLGIVQGILNKFIYLITVNKEPEGVISVKNPFREYRPPLPS